jgi:hypothetical protein
VRCHGADGELDYAGQQASVKLLRGTHDEETLTTDLYRVHAYIIEDTTSG